MNEWLLNRIPTDLQAEGEIIIFQAMRATFVRSYIEAKRAYPWSFFVHNVLAGVFLSIFAYLTYHFVFEGELSAEFVASTGSNDYISYVILGGLLFAFSISLLMILSRSLITELREGTYEALLLTPSSRKGYFLGRMSQGFVQIGLEFISILLVGLILGLQLSGINISSLIIVLTCLTFAIFAQALVLGALMLFLRDTYLTQNTLILLMGLLCGVTFPVSFLPTAVQWISGAMPLTYGLSATREVWLMDASLSEVSSSLIALLGLGFVYLIIGSFLIKKTEKSVFERHYG